MICRFGLTTMHGRLVNLNVPFLLHGLSQKLESASGGQRCDAVFIDTVGGQTLFGRVVLFSWHLYILAPDAASVHALLRGPSLRHTCTFRIDA
jgi:hypothetical protein